MAHPEMTQLPTSIRVGDRMTANEMRALKEHTGRTLTELMGGDDDDLDLAPDRIQSMVWIALRRAGYDVTWDEAGDVLPETAPEPPDPTLIEPSSSSSTSAAGGA